MTLPKGFGSGGTERCQKCDHRISRFDNVCKYCEKYENKIIVPISKQDIGIGVFLFIHYSCIITLIYSVITENIFGIIFSPFAIGISTVIVALVAMDNYRHGDRIRNKCFFMYVPIARFINKFRFTEVEE